MSATRVPLWINVISVALGVLLVYLTARWERNKADQAGRKGVVVDFKVENLPGEPPLKKAA